MGRKGLPTPGRPHGFREYSMYIWKKLYILMFRVLQDSGISIRLIWLIVLFKSSVSCIFFLIVRLRLGNWSSQLVLFNHLFLLSVLLVFASCVLGTVVKVYIVQWLYVHLEGCVTITTIHFQNFSSSQTEFHIH